MPVRSDGLQTSRLPLRLDAGSSKVGQRRPTCNLCAGLTGSTRPTRGSLFFVRKVFYPPRFLRSFDRLHKILFRFSTPCYAEKICVLSPLRVKWIHNQIYGCNEVLRARAVTVLWELSVRRRRFFFFVCQGNTAQFSARALLANISVTLHKNPRKSDKDSLRFLPRLTKIPAAQSAHHNYAVSPKKFQ